MYYISENLRCQDIKIPADFAQVQRVVILSLRLAFGTFETSELYA